MPLWKKRSTPAAKNGSGEARERRLPRLRPDPSARPRLAGYLPPRSSGRSSRARSRSRSSRSCSSSSRASSSRSGCYALFLGWKFAVGFVLLILLHEIGHYIEAKREGLDPKLPVFIPFLGAYVQYTRGQPVADGAGRARRPDPRRARRARLLPDRPVAGLRPVPRARLHRLLPEPDQPDPGRDPRRRCDLAVGELAPARRRPGQGDDRLRALRRDGGRARRRHGRRARAAQPRP